MNTVTKCGFTERNYTGWHLRSCVERVGVGGNEKVGMLTILTVAMRNHKVEQIGVGHEILRTWKCGLLSYHGLEE